MIRSLVLRIISELFVMTLILTLLLAIFFRDETECRQRYGKSFKALEKYRTRTPTSYTFEGKMTCIFYGYVSPVI